MLVRSLARAVLSEAKLGEIMSKSKTGSAASPAESEKEVGRIRDIIFGDQMKDYDHRFVAFQSDLDSLHEELDGVRKQLADENARLTKRMQTQRDELRTAIDDARAELRRSAEHHSSVHLERERLAELLDRVSVELRSSPDVVSELIDHVSNDAAD